MPSVIDVYEKIRSKVNDSQDNSSMIDEASGLPKGLQPTSIPGIYTNAEDTKFDPRDCSNPRNATSPFCGYNPISTKPIGLGGSVSKTKCGINLQVQPTLGFIDLPPVDIAYINENCRTEYESRNTPEKPNDPVAIPGQQFPAKGFAPNVTHGGLNPACNYLFELAPNVPDSSDAPSWVRSERFNWFDVTTFGRRFYGWHTGTEPVIKDANENIFNFNGCVILISHFYLLNTDFWNGRIDSTYGTNLDGSCYATTETTYTRFRGWQNWEFGNCEKYEQATRAIELESYRLTNAYSRTSPEAYWMEGEYKLNCGQVNLQLNFSTNKSGSWSVGGGKSPNFFMGRGSDIERYFNEAKFDHPTKRYSVRSYKELDCDVSDKYKLPYNNCYPKPTPCCCDDVGSVKPCYGENDVSCCDNNNDELLAILRKIDRKIGEFPKKVSVWDDDPETLDRQKKEKSIESIAGSIEQLVKMINDTQQIIGIEEFPGKFPDSIVVPQAQNNLEKIWNWIKPKKERNIKNLVQLIDWCNDQQSAVQGQWHQYIEYEKKDGKNVKKEKVVLPDMATTLRELFKMVTVLIQTNGMSTDIGLKTLQNSTNNSLMLLKCQTIVEDIQDALDYVTGEEELEYQAQINPSEKTNTLEEYLKPTKLKVKAHKWKPDIDTSIQEDLDDIKQTLAIVRLNLGGEQNR